MDLQWVMTLVGIFVGWVGWFFIAALCGCAIGMTMRADLDWYYRLCGPIMTILGIYLMLVFTDAERSLQVGDQLGQIYTYGSLAFLLWGFCLGAIAAQEADFGEKKSSVITPDDQLVEQ